MSAVDDAIGAVGTGSIAIGRRRRAAVITAPHARSPRATPTLERRRLWEKKYRNRLIITDTVVIVIAVVATSVLQLNFLSPTLLLADPWILTRLPLVSAAAWLLMLSLFNTRAPGIIGSGATEYMRVAHATGLAFGILAILFVVFQWQGIRAQLLVALPVGLIALLVARWRWRHWLTERQRAGEYVSRAIVVGDAADIEYVIRQFSSSGATGYRVVGAAVTDVDDDTLVIDGASYQVVGHPRAAAQAATTMSADTIIVASRPDGDPDYVKRLSWQLEGTAAELILSSRLTDVAGPRISLRPVDGLPLLHVKIPTFDGGAHLLKRALDIAVSFVALVLFAPFALLIAGAIALDSRGPVFFRQKRVGRDGREFSILKFRSMRTSAEMELDALRSSNEGAGPLFKIRNDPRVTRVGRFLRRYSLDEVPQFWNVLVGDMSVVGPRPPLPAEVTAYDGTVIRRLYIKPGITGLWQVSGRSDLTWDESVRLDLRYVENWSVISDLMIMWQTAKVMLDPRGAY